MRRRDLNVRSKQASRTSYEQVEEVRRVAVCRESASHDYGHPGRRRSNPCQPLAARRSHLWRAGDHTYAAIFRCPRRSRLDPGSSAVLLPSRAIRWDERCLCLGNLEDLQCHDSDRPRLRPTRGGHGSLGLQPGEAAHGHAMALEHRIGNARDLLLHASLLRSVPPLRKPSSGSGTLLLYGHRRDQGVSSPMRLSSAPDLSVYAHWSVRIPAHAPVLFGRADAPGWRQGLPSLANAISALPLSPGRMSVRAGFCDLSPAYGFSSLLAAA